MAFQSARQAQTTGPNSLNASGAISARDAQRIVQIVQRLSGVAIDAANTSFLELRVSRRLRALSMDRMSDYISRLEGLEGPTEAHHLVEALVTHTTNFFREPAHFDFLANKGLAERVALGAGREWPLTIWSAACSNGAELWSAGMVLDQFSRRQLNSISWALVGTDISRKILRKAANAVYTQDELLGMSEELRRRYLMRSKMKTVGTDTSLFRIAPELRTMARFHWANLVDFPVTVDLLADVVFLRNVLIYFQPEQKLAAIRAATTRLRPGGFLITGHAEGLTPIPAGLEQLGPSIYRKSQNEA